jgi:hypothetical protein
MDSSMKLIIMCIHGVIFLSRMAIIGGMIAYLKSYDSLKCFEYYSQYYSTIGIGILCLCDLYEFFLAYNISNRVPLLNNEVVDNNKSCNFIIMAYSIPILPIIGLMTKLDSFNNTRSGGASFLLILIYFFSLIINCFLRIIGNSDNIEILNNDDDDTYNNV